MQQTKSAILLCVFSLAGLAAPGVARAQAAAVSAISKTDVAVSLYGAFSGKTTGNGIEESPSNSAGGMIEVRHIRNPLVGFEGTYSFNHANQVYRSLVCSLDCSQTPAQAVSADAHEVTADWLASLKLANLRPFALAGGGLIVDVPSSAQSSQSSPTSTSTKAVFVYGAGLDVGLLPHFGVRLQYRGNVYSAPELIKSVGSTHTALDTSEPMIGVYLRL
jgi:opacity protein-like surface antigen